MIDRERAHKAVEFLIESSAEIGRAKAEASRTDDMLKHVKALSMAASDEKSAAGQERDALASAHYLKAIDAKFAATERAETLKAQREAAVMTIEVWRTDQANQRIADRGRGA